MATIYDVAKLAGVSPATVSRAFNGANVSEEKKLAIQDAARQLAFTPNRTARSLRRQASEVIALVIPDIQNPYYTEVARGVEDAAQDAGYSVVLCNSDADSDKESVYLQIADAEHMAGVIIASATGRSDLAHTLAVGRPVVAVDRSTGHDVDEVVMPNRSAGERATENLVDAGFRRIACVTGPRNIATAHERALGWRAVMERRLPDVADDHLLRYSTFGVEGGRDAMTELLELPDPPDAVVAGNNLLGVGVIQVLAERGLTPPGFGVAVIGSLPFTTLSPRAVTVVRLPAQEMGTTAARLLLERIAGADAPARRVILHDRLQPAEFPPRQ